MSNVNPDDLVPVNVKQLVAYASDVEKCGRSVVMVMAGNATTPFGIGVCKKAGKIVGLREFREKPELALTKNHFANTGMILFLPDAMKEFKKVPRDRPSNPESEMMPRLVKRNKVAVFIVERWISIIYAADYKNVLNMGSEKLERFLDV